MNRTMTVANSRHEQKLPDRAYHHLLPSAWLLQFASRAAMRFYSLMLIYKICRAAEWASVEHEYSGSAHDRADGFLHFSTQAQLAGTLQRYYAGADDLVLVAVEEKSLGPALRWEYAASRGEDLPSLRLLALGSSDMGAAPGAPLTGASIMTRSRTRRSGAGQSEQSRDPGPAAGTGRRDAGWCRVRCSRRCGMLLTGRGPATHGIKRLRHFLFRSRSVVPEAEDGGWIRRADALFADLRVEIEVRNQGRVHVWYTEKFGMPIIRTLSRRRDGIDRFLSRLRDDRHAACDARTPMASMHGEAMRTSRI